MCLTSLELAPVTLLLCVLGLDGRVRDRVRFRVSVRIFNVSNHRVANVVIIYMSCMYRVLVEQLTAEKQQLHAAYSDAVAALQHLLADSREMHALLLHTHTYAVSLHTAVIASCP